MIHHKDEALKKLCPLTLLTCVADDCMIWRWEFRPFDNVEPEPRQGYCGLVGMFHHAQQATPNPTEYDEV